MVYRYGIELQWYTRAIGIKLMSGLYVMLNIMMFSIRYHEVGVSLHTS
jgi:hypothetical protein